jgi:phage shock protein PspC (stress-responsive transcriptional regulator)
MLFHRKTQKVLKVAWVVLVVFIIISMIVLYIPALRYGSF